MSEERVAIGIAFGNSNSSIAYTTAEGKAEVIANEEGDRQIPTILSYVGGEEVHGTQAKAQLVRNAKNTVAYFRDFLGQSFKSIDPTACHQLAHPREHGSTVAFSIQDTEDNKESMVTVSEITTRHLRRLRTSATDFLGKEVNAAVITVPTNFSDAQKEALAKAAQDAGLEVLQFINEPVAAVLAYDARPGAEVADKIIVVADLGGIRSDVAVIASRGGMYTTLATVHDYDVGGAQLDEVLMDFFATEFKKKNKDAEDPRKNDRSLAKLKLESEAVKKALSLSANATFSVESLSSALDFTCTINRTRYELKAGKSFAAITRLVQHAVHKAQLDPLDVDEIILSGGTSHTPRIAANLAAAFPESTTVFAPASRADALDPSELAARGAAIQASLIADFDRDDIEESCHPVVTVTRHTQHAIGVMCVSADEHAPSAVFHPVLEPDTPVPARRTATFPVPGSGGDVLVKVCEASRHIKVETRPKQTPNGAPDGDAKHHGSGSDDSDASDSDETDTETRRRVWKVGRLVAEAAVRGVAKGASIEVQINVAPDLGVTVIAREVGGKSGVRGVVGAPGVEANGVA